MDVRLKHRIVRVALIFVVVIGAVGLHAGQAAAQAQNRGRNGAGAGPPTGEGVSPAEIQRLFDAYVVMQAQQELQLSDEQYPKFLARVKVLQDVRRRGQIERARILQELRRLSQATPVEEDRIREKLKALGDLETRALADVREAFDGVDQVLDVRQQARFRLFEEQMERRKVELLMRARQANRPRNQF